MPRRTIYTCILLLPWGGMPACVGPRSGLLGELRLVNRLREFESSESLPPGPGDSQVPLFPVFFRDSNSSSCGTEVLWPLWQWGSGDRSDYFQFWPLLSDRSFPDGQSFTLFPIFWHGRKNLESGKVAYDHLWPLFGVHEAPIDQAQTVTCHVAWPVFFWRWSDRQWRMRLFPLADLSRGSIDRGWWFFPILKIGGDRRGNGWFFIADPLFSWERHSTAEEGEALAEKNSRVAVLILGGLLGWEVGEGVLHWRILWISM